MTSTDEYKQVTTAAGLAWAIRQGRKIYAVHATPKSSVSLVKEARCVGRKFTAFLTDGTRIEAFTLYAGPQTIFPQKKKPATVQLPLF